MSEKTAYYFFEYDRPPNPKTGRPLKPGRTTWRMTIEHAKEMYGDGYRPILSTVEYRDSQPAAVFGSFKPYGAGQSQVEIRLAREAAERGEKPV